MNFFRRVLGDFLNIHAALGTRHQADALRAAINHHTDVEFFLDVCAFLDQQTAHLLALGAGLVRLEHHAQDLLRVAFDLIERACQLDTAAFAASTGMNLRLNDPNLATQRSSGRLGFLNAETRNAARRHNAKTAQYFFCLIFVNLHELPCLLRVTNFTAQPAYPAIQPSVSSNPSRRRMDCSD